jgi:hypothetical protein
MEKSKVIELSRWTADNTVSNAEWSNHLSTPVVINNGDIVSVRNSFIDTTLITTTAIEIEEDITLTLNIIYYIINTGVGLYFAIYGKENNIPKPVFIQTFNNQDVFEPTYQLNGPDGLPYVLVYDTPDIPATNGKPIVETIYIKIPKNVYEKTALAKLITTQLELVNIQPTNQIMSSISQQFTNGEVFPESTSDGTFFQFSEPLTKPDPSKVITTIQKQVYYGINFVTPNVQKLFVYDATNELVACKLVPMTDNPNYCDISHLPTGTIITPITQIPESNQIIPLVEYDDESYFLWDCGFIGASEFSFVFDPDSNRFNIEYMHTPIIQSGNEVCMSFTNQIGYANPASNLNKRISYMTAQSGLMIVNCYTKYNPEEITEVPFLNQLGFNLNDLVDLEDLYTVFNGNNNMLSPTYNKFKYTNFLKYTTRNYAPMGILSQSGASVTIPAIVPNKDNVIYTMAINPSMFFTTFDSSNTSPYKVRGAGFSVVDSNITIQIIASNPAKSSNTQTGHFLLDLSSYPSDYINSQKTYNIKSIIGNYYYANSFCEATYEPLIYQHIGEPIVLSRIDVKIMSPYTKKPATNLGENSSVYLQVTNQIQPLQQTEQKK